MSIWGGGGVWGVYTLTKHNKHYSHRFTQIPPPPHTLCLYSPSHSLCFVCLGKKLILRTL